MVNGLTPNYKLKRYLFSRGINDNRTINATLAEAIKYQRNLDKPMKERETINSTLLDSKTKTWISKNIPNLKNTSNILKLIDRLKPYTRLVRGGSFSIGTNKKSIVFVPNNTIGTEDIHPSMRTYLTDKLFNADNDNRLYVSISKLKDLIQSGAYTKELNELFNQIKSRLPFEISVLTVSNKQEFMVRLNEFVDQYESSTDNKGRAQVLNTLTEEGSIEKLKKNWESVKRIIRKNIPIGKVPTNETVDAIYEDLKQGYKIENLGKLFLEGSDFENQLEEKVSNSSTSKTYGWWIRRVMVRKKGLKSLLEVSEEDREYSLNQEDDSFFDKKPDDSVDRSPQKPKIDNYILYIFRNTKGEKVRVVTRDYGGGTLKPNKIQSILDKNYQGESPYSLEKTAKLSEEAYKKLGEKVINESEKFKEIATKLVDRYLRTTDDNEIYFDAEMFGEQLDKPVSYYFDGSMFNDTTEAEERLRRYVRKDVIEWTSKPIIRNINQFSSPIYSGEKLEVNPLVAGVKIGSKEEIIGWINKKRLVHGGQFDSNVELDPELFKMEVSELPEDDRRRIKTFLQDAEPTEFFGEEYLKLTKLINTLGDIVDSSEEGQLEGLDEENLKLIKKLAHLRKRYENLYQDIYGMVYGEEE
jgi:hypothetical protein